MNKKWYLFDLKEFNEDKGNMNVLQIDESPLKFERVFYQYNIPPNVSRGDHSNKKSRFIIIAIQGSLQIELTYKNYSEVININNPSKALFLENLVWKKMYNYSNDCILLVLSDSLYDKNEYIFSIEEYKKYMEEYE